MNLDEAKAFVKQNYDSLTLEQSIKLAIICLKTFYIDPVGLAWANNWSTAETPEDAASVVESLRNADIAVNIPQPSSEAVSRIKVTVMDAAWAWLKKDKGPALHSVVHSVLVNPNIDLNVFVKQVT